MAPQRPERISTSITPGAVTATAEAVRTMFVNSVSGPKQYNFKPSRWNEYAPSGIRLDRFGEGAQFFQVIEIDGDKIDYRAYAATGDLYDSFIMTKSAGGAKIVTAGPPATLEQQIYSPANPKRPFGGEARGD